MRNGHRYLTQSNRLLWIIPGARVGVADRLGHDRVRPSPCAASPTKKKAGAAWLDENADHIANLRVLRANRQWPVFLINLTHF